MILTFSNGITQSRPHPASAAKGLVSGGGLGPQQT